MDRHGPDAPSGKLAPAAAARELLRWIPHAPDLAASVEKMLGPARMEISAYGLLASRLHDLMLRGDERATRDAFDAVERAFEHGDDETSALLASLLDDLRNILVAGDPARPAPPLPYLGPRSSRHWHAA